MSITRPSILAAMPQVNANTPMEKIPQLANNSKIDRVVKDFPVKSHVVGDMVRDQLKQLKRRARKIMIPKVKTMSDKDKRRGIRMEFKNMKRKKNRKPTLMPIPRTRKSKVIK